MTSLQVQCEVYEQKNYDLTEENKVLNQKYSEVDSKINKFERDNIRLTSEVNIITFIVINNIIIMRFVLIGALIIFIF